MIEICMLMMGVTLVIWAMMEIGLSKQAVRVRTLKHLKMQKIFNQAINRRVGQADDDRFE